MQPLYLARWPCQFLSISSSRMLNTGLVYCNSVLGETSDSIRQQTYSGVGTRLKQWIMDFKELGSSFFAGVIIGILVNKFFPFLISLTIENTSSLDPHLRVVFILIPLVLLAYPVITTFESIESFIAGVGGVIFSIFVLRSVGITEVVLIFAIMIFGFWWIHNRIKKLI